ncbi:dynein light chain roadblock-type 2 isoform X1 [Rhinolophus ferrumequinum]|uniref:dynein light chain roadblock-type 2 isoform X1 n=1 Tax=Rhinolophus ferrumequinum TaxID=59479 RepID=UPI00140F9A00|nr:dynein light chain roadblock-type 2 isoform X1 [Rhinolophus ferrumequinum]
MNERTNDPEHGLGTSPLLGPIAPRAWVKPRCALGATGPNHLLRRPGGARQAQGGKAVLAAARPLRTQARALTLPGGHFLPRLLATAGSVVDIPGSCGVGLSPEPRSPRDGIPIRTTLDNSTTVQYAGLLHQLTMKAKSTVRDIDPQNDLTFLRIRSKKHEIMVAPDKEYLLIVIQNPCE